MLGQITLLQHSGLNDRVAIENRTVESLMHRPCAWYIPPRSSARAIGPLPSLSNVSFTMHSHYLATLGVLYLSILCTVCAVT